MTVPLLRAQEAYAMWAEEYPPYAHNAFMQAEERALLAELPAELNGYNVLDVGCGSGRYLGHALRRGAATAVGVDLSMEMLLRARAELGAEGAVASGSHALALSSVAQTPVRDGWADVTICALTLGHVSELGPAIQELRRVTRRDGLILCSDMHPIGAERGWQRTFTHRGSRFAVEHWTHSVADWRRVCHDAELTIDSVAEPSISIVDVPDGARFDTEALAIPAVIVIAMRVGGRAADES